MKAICRMSFACGRVPKVGMRTAGTIIPKRAPGKFRIVQASNAIMAYIEIDYSMP